MDEHANAAHDLVGRKLKSGWEVIDKIEKYPGQTGSFFSVCYRVKQESEICFLKAFDFAKFFRLSASSGTTTSIVDVMANMLNAHKFERDLSQLCQKHHVTKVVFVREAGEEAIDGYAIPIVPYLIFELADGDVRNKLSFFNNLDIAWKLKSLHDICVGLKQLHNIEVSHQDLKPSNVLLFGDDSKIGDLGRSISKNIAAPHDEQPFTGQWSYAPPEILYEVYSSEWTKRSYAADCYLFGNLIVFYFSGITINALIRNYLPDNVSWEFWKGSDFSEVKDYLLQAFEKALDEFSSNIELDFLRDELRQAVYQLCYPLPAKRGHPKNINGSGNNFNMERYISKFDYLSKRFEYELLKVNKNG